MKNFKIFLGISIPVAIVIGFFASIGKTVFLICFGYALLAGIFWKFAKHF